MNLAVLPDGRVLHTTRQGEIRIYHPDSGLNTLAATLDVYQHDEEGLQNVAVDPNFEKNNWVYVYYSPPLKTPADDPKTPALNEGDAPEYGTPAEFARFKGHLQLSRMKLKGEKVDPKTEQKILQVPVDRGMCCHVGGNIDFDDAGNLYLSTGDDSNPFSSDGYAPLDDSREPQPGLRRPPQRRQHERPARQDPADPSEGQRRLHDPEGQPVPQGQGEDQARDLRDGPAQPVPVRGQPRQRRRVRGRLLAGRRQGRPRARPGRATAAGSSSRSRRTTAGRTA